MRNNENSRTIQLVEEHFHPDEAWEMLNELLAEQALRHNIRELRKWESNHRFEPRLLDKAIHGLKVQRQAVKTLLEEAKNRGFSIEIKASIEVTICNEPRHTV